MSYETGNKSSETDEKVSPNRLQGSKLTENPVYKSGRSSKTQSHKHKKSQDYYQNSRTERAHHINSGYKPHTNIIWLRDQHLAKEVLNHMCNTSDYQYVQYDPYLQDNSYNNLNVTYRSRTYDNPVYTGHSNDTPMHRSNNQNPAFNNRITNEQNKNNRNYIREHNPYWRNDGNLRPAYKHDPNKFYNESTSCRQENYYNFPYHPPGWYKSSMQPTNSPSSSLTNPSLASRKKYHSYTLPDFNIYDEASSDESNKQPNSLQLPKHEFTGWAGYNWPTIRKTTPKKDDPEEENMRVYTKPSFSHRRTYSSDFIKKALKKYTNRLKLLIFKHFPEGFEVKAGHLETVDDERKENIQPGQKEN